VWPASARFLDQPLRQHLDGYEPDLVAFPLDPKMQHALPALHVLYTQATELLAADAMIEQGGQYRPIADALEGIVGWRVEQLAGLSITEGWGAAFIVVGHWALDAVDRRPLAFAAAYCYKFASVRYPCDLKVVATLSKLFLRV
jgi:hypothetical protein